MKVIIYAPHVCLLSSPLLEPGCDYKSKTYARAISKVIPNSVVIQSRTLRAECDNNRIKCRNTPSRKRLRDVINKNNFILEVHTFKAGGNVWNYGSDPEIVLLTVGKNEYITRYIYDALKKDFDVKMLKGSTRNDIQMEVQEKNSQGVLIEFRQDLSDDRVENIGKIINFI